MGPEWSVGPPIQAHTLFWSKSGFSGWFSASRAAKNWRNPLLELEVYFMGFETIHFALPNSKKLLQVGVQGPKRLTFFPHFPCFPGFCLSLFASWQGLVCWKDLTRRLQWTIALPKGSGATLKSFEEEGKPHWVQVPRKPRLERALFKEYSCHFLTALELTGPCHSHHLSPSTCLVLKFVSEYYGILRYWDNERLRKVKGLED